jgi:hypothetical protein
LNSEPAADLNVVAFLIASSHLTYSKYELVKSKPWLRSGPILLLPSSRSSQCIVTGNFFSRGEEIKQLNRPRASATPAASILKKFPNGESVLGEIARFTTFRLERSNCPGGAQQWETSASQHVPMRRAGAAGALNDTSNL